MKWRLQSTAFYRFDCQEGHIASWSEFFVWYLATFFMFELIDIVFDTRQKLENCRKY